MPEFPDTPRAEYQHSPLEQVICQVRFPPILRIDADVPAEFQEAIRSQYPDVRESKTLEVPLGAPPELAELLGRALAGRASYDFVSEDTHWYVSLTREFMALTTTAYRTWADFVEHLTEPLAALESIYRPSHYVRIGLRYRDVVARGDIGLAGVPWSELLAPPVVGLLGDTTVADGVTEAKSETLVVLDESRGSVRVRHGLASREGSDELCFLIDADFFSDARTELGGALGTLGYFNGQAGRLFRWAITPRLHEALGPRPR